MALDLEQIPLTPADFPYDITLPIDSVNYLIEFRYNDVYDFFTINFKDESDESIYASRIKYLGQVIHVVVAGLSQITSDIKAFSLNDLESGGSRDINVNAATLGDSVGLYVIP